MDRRRTSSAWVLSIIALSTGCFAKRDAPTIWKQELASPDGSWMATAHTEQDGGFGSAFIGTSADLRSVNKAVNQGKVQNVIFFSCNGPAAHAYTFDPANAGGTIGLKMRWLSPTHLEVTYDQPAELDFQVVRLANLEISLRNLATLS